MIKISKQNNSLIVEGIENVFYPNNGDNSYPLNSLIVVTDNSDMATFRSVATNDVLFSGLIQNITINGEAVTKDNIIEKFDTVSNSSTGGGTVDAYTKEEADNKFASKDELTNVQTVANDADTKADALTPRVESVETSLGNKQDTLVSGTNIKTINNQSILGEGNIEISDYYTKTEADEIFATTIQVNHQAADISALQTDMRGKQATLVSGENIKTINSESILGSGDIQINGVSDEQAQEIAKIPTIESELAQKANASDVATQQEVNVIAANVSALESDMANKQPTLVSGTNIKTINGESVLGEGNIEVAKKTDIPSTDNLATKDELTAVETVANNADAKADAATSRVESVETSLGNKQDTLVSGTNIKTINSQSILGSGDLAISGGIKIYEASEMPKNLKDALYQVVYEAYYTSNKVVTIDKSTDVEEFLSNLKTGDYLQVTEKILIQYYGTISDIYKFAIKTGKEISGKEQYGRLITVEIIANMFFITNNTSGPVLQKNDLKTINGESLIGEGNIEISGGEVDLTNYYTKTEADGKFATITGFNEQAADISALQTAMDGKQPTLVSGTNIKTINGNSILGEGNLVIEGGDIDLSNYYNKTEVDTKLDTKQNTLVSGTNIKTINSQSILGSGDLTISGVSEEQAQEIAKIPTIESELAQKADASDVPTIQTDHNGTNKNYIYSDENDEAHRAISKVGMSSNHERLELKYNFWGATMGYYDIISGATTSKAGVMTAADKTKLDSISNEWTGTQSEFDALTTKEDNIIYYVTE